MSISTLRWARGSALALIISLVACSGQQPGSGGLMPAGASPAQAARSAAGSSWMAPDAKSKDLLYVTDGNADEVEIFSYPQMKREGAVPGFDQPFGACADKSGDIFIANTGASDILEYAHGGTRPIETLSDPGYEPRGCSIDPTTGNLAVANYISTPAGGPGNVAIYTDAKGTPTYYSPPSIVYGVFSCGYDDKGNLFMDGQDFGSAFEFAELPSGAKTFTSVTLDQAFELPGGVQWDGKYVAVGDAELGAIYQFSIQGTKGTKVGTTPLNGVAGAYGFWIQGSKVVVPFSGSQGTGTHGVGIWLYPAGGSAKKLSKFLQYPSGAAVSKAK